MSASGDSSRFKLLVVGVGGQGALTAARFLGEAALSADLPVMVSQLHGMSQRGGSVECSVLIGEGQSSFVGKGQADVILGLEPMELLRALPKLSSRTRVVFNLGQIVPFSLAMRGESYPSVDDMLDEVRSITKTLYPIDGPALVAKTGVPRTLNVVMLGALAGLEMLPFDDQVLWSAVEKKSKPRFIDANRMAFDLGFQAVKNN